MFGLCSSDQDTKATTVVKADYNCLFKCTNYRNKNAESEHNLDNEIQIFTSAREPFSGSEQSVGVSDV